MLTSFTWRSRECRDKNWGTIWRNRRDQHLNMILGEVEETITTIEIDEETFEQIYRVN